MAKFKKTIVAGSLVIETIYPAPNPRDSQAVRCGKRKLSSEVQRRMNLKYAYQKLELLIAANFQPGDIWATFTYDGAHLPPDRKAANARMNSFFRKLRTARQGEIVKYIYVTEHKHGEGRFHHHVLLNAVGGDYELIHKLWDGGAVEFEKIKVDRDYNYESLARYMCKEQRDKLGYRLWSGSRTLSKPECTCERVPNDTPLRPPKSASLVFEDTGDVVTAFGHYRYIKYLVGKPDRKTRRRKSRKRFL